MIHRQITQNQVIQIHMCLTETSMNHSLAHPPLHTNSNASSNPIKADTC